MLVGLCHFVFSPGAMARRKDEKDESLTSSTAKQSHMQIHPIVNLLKLNNGCMLVFIGVRLNEKQDEPQFLIYTL